jgi:hypothetical protein
VQALIDWLPTEGHRRVAQGDRGPRGSAGPRAAADRRQCPAPGPGPVGREPRRGHVDPVGGRTGRGLPNLYLKRWLGARAVLYVVYSVLEPFSS